jgi:excisionase family DNA binding protein
MNTASKITCSVREATELTGLGRTTIYSLLAEGRITSTHVGTKRLIHVDSLRRLLEAA